MANKKQYGEPANYEAKLARVMVRFGVKEDEYNYDYSRKAAFVEFRLKGQLYRFDHSVEKAQARGISIQYGSDVFSQIVLSLEELARMSERGIYDIQTWLAGMKYLPPPIVVPDFIKALGYEQIPESIEDLKTRYHSLAQTAHPDAGGTEDAFIKLKDSYEKAVTYIQSL